MKFQIFEKGFFMIDAHEKKSHERESRIEDKTNEREILIMIGWIKLVPVIYVESREAKAPLLGISQKAVGNHQIEFLINYDLIWGHSGAIIKVSESGTFTINVVIRVSVDVNR